MDIILDGDDKSFKIKGEVANTNRIGMGIEFEEVSSNLQKKLVIFYIRSFNFETKIILFHSIGVKIG